uniref:Uncharacterized protein n=1 Tax=Arundo donax TaxID=35708 RepID=A0A0A9BRN0_ARUDO
MKCNLYTNMLGIDIYVVLKYFLSFLSLCYVTKSSR